MDSSPALPDLKPSSAPRAFFIGLGLPFRALSLIARSPKLLGLAALMGLVAAGTLAGVGAWLWSASREWAETLVAGRQDSTWGAAAAATVHVALFVGGFVLSALTVPQLALAPLQDPLSEATEARVAAFTPPPFSVRALVRGTVESLSHTLLRLAAMAVGLLVLAPLNLIPGAGSVLWVALSSTWTMFWLGVEHLSTPASRHLVSFRQVVGALARRPALALGFGAALWVLLWVPVLNVLLLPIAVVAGTLLFRAMVAAGALVLAS